MAIKAKIDSKRKLLITRNGGLTPAYCPRVPDTLIECGDYCVLFGEPERQESGSNILTICDGKWFEIEKEER